MDAGAGSLGDGIRRRRLGHRRSQDGSGFAVVRQGVLEAVFESLGQKVGLPGFDIKDVAHVIAAGFAGDRREIFLIAIGLRKMRTQMEFGDGFESWEMEREA